MALTEKQFNALKASDPLKRQYGTYRAYWIAQNPVKAQKAVAAQGGVQASANGEKFVLDQSFMDAYGKDDPKLALARDAYMAGNTALAAQALMSSDFWTNHSETSRSRLQLKTAQPGVYEQQLTSYKMLMKQTLVARGLAISDADLDAAAAKAFDAGLDVNDPQALSFTDSYITGIKGGRAQDAVSSLKGLAASMGVQYSDSWFDTAAMSVANGNATIEEYQQTIKDLAKSQFPQFAKQIDAGLTVDQISSPYKAKIQSVLELNANEITLDNNLMQMALNSKDAQGNLVPMSLYEFEKALRNDPRWGYTKNARESIDSTMRGVLQNFGFAW